MRSRREHDMAQKIALRGAWYDCTVVRSTMTVRRKVYQTLHRMWSGRRDSLRSSCQWEEETRLAEFVSLFANIRQILTNFEGDIAQEIFHFNNSHECLQPLVTHTSLNRMSTWQKTNVVIEDSGTLTDICPPRYPIDNWIPLVDYNDHDVARCTFCLFLENFMRRVL